MLKLTQGTTGTGSTLLSAEHQSDFHAITRVLQHRAINMSIETEEFLVGRKWCAAAGILIGFVSLDFAFTWLSNSYKTHLSPVKAACAFFILPIRCATTAFLSFPGPRGKTLVYREACDPCSSCLENAQTRAALCRTVLHVLLGLQDRAVLYISLAKREKILEKNLFLSICPSS